MENLNALIFSAPAGGKPTAKQERYWKEGGIVYRQVNGGPVEKTELTELPDISFRA